jgi:hypothetical protein
MRFHRSGSTVAASFPCARADPGLRYSRMHTMVHRVSISSTVIVLYRDCCESGFVIPLFSDRYSTKD